MGDSRPQGSKKRSLQFGAAGAGIATSQPARRKKSKSSEPGADVDTDELQLALALSRSLAEAKPASPSPPVAAPESPLGTPRKALAASSRRLVDRVAQLCGDRVEHGLVDGALPESELGKTYANPSPSPELASGTSDVTVEEVFDSGVVDIGTAYARALHFRRLRLEEDMRRLQETYREDVEAIELDRDRHMEEFRSMCDIPVMTACERVAMACSISIDDGGKLQIPDELCRK
jgi:hypothetical protein